MIELDIRNSQPLIATILLKQYWNAKTKQLPQDVMDYQANCENGSFYNYFMDLNDIPDTEKARTDFKKQFFAEVFFSEVKTRKSKLKNQFIKRYPSCYEAICAIKGGLGSKDYNQFAINLQRTEASIIFDTVNMDLLRKGIPAFNIFDSILTTTEEDCAIAKQMILDAFAKYGLAPTLNKKYY